MLQPRKISSRQLQAIEMVPISCVSNVFTWKYTTIKCGANFWDTRYLEPKCQKWLMCNHIKLPHEAVLYETLSLKKKYSYDVTSPNLNHVFKVSSSLVNIYHPSYLILSGKKLPTWPAEHSILRQIIRVFEVMENVASFFFKLVQALKAPCLNLLLLRFCIKAVAHWTASPLICATCRMRSRESAHARNVIFTRFL